MPNMILLKTYGGRFEEHRVSVAATPGMLGELDSDNKAKPHTVRGGKAERMFFMEDSLQGKTIDDAYAIGALARTWMAVPGEEFNALLHDGENVDEGDKLISYGDGTLAKAASAFLANVVADSTAITATATETTFSNGTVTIPKNTLKVGDIIRIRGQAIATATNSTDTLLIKVYLGSTAVLTMTATDVANNDVLFFDVYLTIRTIGASGTFVANGTWSLGVPGTATMRTGAVGSTAIDTTAAQTITVKATWSTTDAGNSVLLRTLLVEDVKAGSNAGVSGTGDVVAIVREAVDLTSAGANGRVKIRAA